MTDLISTGSTAVAAYQRALGTVSNNIANVGTDGYSRQEVVLQANPAKKEGIIYMGTGVMADRIQRSYDAFAESNLRNSNSDLASQEPMVNYTNRVVDVLGGTTMGLSGAMDQFFASARSLSADPASIVVRGSFVRDAQGLASRFNQLAGQLDLLQNETRDAIETNVVEMNTLVKQLALVNTQMVKQETADSQPPQLLDQRDQLLKQLSTFARLTTQFKSNGSVLVSLGPSGMHDVILDGAKYTPIGADFNSSAPEKVSLVLDPYGKNPQPLTSVTSGQMAGLMSFREQVLGSTRISLDALATMLVREVNTVHQSGVDAYGNAGGTLFSIDPAAASASAGMKVALDDPMLVAAAAQFRVIEDANNPSSADARLEYAPEALQGPPALDHVLVNNPHPSAGKAITLGLVPRAVASVASGLTNVTVYLDSAKPGQQLQLLTRDGRQLMGSAINPSDQALIITTANGFADKASYSTSYLNQSDSAGYKGMHVFYGARAGVLQVPVYDKVGQAMGTQPLAAVLAGGHMPVGQSTGIAAGALKLNGVALDALQPQAGKTLQASDTVAWINAKTAQTGVVASASNETRVSASQFKLSMPLSINGTSIVSASGGIFGGVRDLAAAIQSQSAVTGVTASISPDGELILSNVPSRAGEDIRVAGMGGLTNALGIGDGTISGQISLTRALVAGRDTPIELGFGDTGTPADLAKLGLRTGATVVGAVKDDLLVFVTGAGTASVAASYSGQPADPKQVLRGQPLQIVFSSDTHYTITDLNTKTVVAERDFDPGQLLAGVSYQGLHMALNSPPKAGDKFLIDGNVDGTGNNENMLELAAIESKRVFGGKTLFGGTKTLSMAYIEQVNDIGNIGRQAAIAQASLTVVHDQAVSSRDEVSGVSLDQEAADLIRFQQAYQAAAKTIQVSSQIFDTILHIQ